MATVPSEREVLITLVTGLVLVSAGPAAGQARAGSVHLAAGLAWPHQDGATGEASQTYVTSPGGTTLGWTIGGGVFVTRLVSIDAELAGTGVMRAREPSRYGMTFNEERRDRLLTVAVRFRLSLGAAVSLEPLAGAAVRWGERWSQVERVRPWLPSGQQLEIGPRVHETLPARAGLTLGLDARIGGRRIAAVPSLRVHYAPESDELNWVYPGGSSEWTIAPGIALRMDF